MKSLLIPTLILLFVLSTNLKAQGESHEHGVADLNLVIDQNSLLIAFESPANNIVGFEHQAESNDEKAKIIAALASLKSPQNLVDLPANAGCLLVESDVELHSENAEQNVDTEHEEHEEHEEDHAKHASGHSDFHASYIFTCTDVNALSSLPLMLFKQFPGVEEIHLQAITPWGQIGSDIEAKDALIRLK